MILYNLNKIVYELCKPVQLDGKHNPICFQYENNIKRKRIKNFEISHIV